MPARSLLLSSCLALVAGPALAACLDAGSIDRGVVFTRADGRSGSAIRQGKAIAIDYAPGEAQWVDRRVARLGIFDQSGEVFRPGLAEGEAMVGGGPVSYVWKHASSPPEPAPGKTWSTTLRETTEEEVGLESGPEVIRRSYKASYSFSDPREVTLSGCSYRGITVEASYSAPGQSFERRWIYFPDLGFALETRSSDPRGHSPAGTRKLGLSALRPAG
jgi:hypothetical protein